MDALAGQQAGMAALVQQAARDPTLFAAQLALADEELMARLDPHSRQRVHDIMAGGVTPHPEPSGARPAAAVRLAFRNSPMLAAPRKRPTPIDDAQGCVAAPLLVLSPQVSRPARSTRRRRKRQRSKSPRAPAAGNVEDVFAGLGARARGAVLGSAAPITASARQAHRAARRRQARVAAAAAATAGATARPRPISAARDSEA